VNEVNEVNETHLRFYAYAKAPCLGEREKESAPADQSEALSFKQPGHPAPARPIITTLPGKINGG